MAPESMGGPVACRPPARDARAGRGDDSPPVSASMDGAQNPERRSDAAVLCLCIGIGFLGMAWLLGLGGAIGAIASGGWTPAFAGGVIAFLLVPMAGVLGVLFVGAGFVWIIIRVIVDQRRDHANDRYSRDVER